MSQCGNAFWKMSKRWPVSMVEGPKINYSFFQWDIVLLVGNLISSVQSLSCVPLFATPWIAACQASQSITNSQSSLKLTSIQLVMSSNHLILCHPILLCPQNFPASGSFQKGQLFASGDQSIGVSASTLVLPMNTQDWSPLGWTGCSPRDSQESSPTPRFKCINSSVLHFLCSPTLTSIHDHWENCSLD